MEKLGSRHAAVGLALALAFLTAACATATVSPLPTGAPPGSEPPAPTAVPGSSSAPAGVLTVTAQNIAFQPTSLAAPAGTPLSFVLVNADAGVPHNLAIVDGSGAERFASEIVAGPTQLTFATPALEAGRYTFLCKVHPNMTGTLSVGNG